MIKRVKKATAEYATSETVNLGYNGPLTIVAAGNLYGIPYDFLKTLSSTGVVLKHFTSRLSVIVPSYLRSRTSHSSLSIMLITTNSGLLDSIIRKIYMGVLIGYNLLLAYPPSYEPEDPHPSSLVSVGGEWLWDRSSLLKVSGLEEEETRRLVVDTTSCEMFSCASCPANNLEIDNEESESPLLHMIKERQKTKNSERLKNEREARKLKYEKLAHKHFS
ncbi:hypothetical protein Bca4012_101561 [Brassica carinata]|uniref:Uncharacterized protein n=1 Tax=Brassica carinata TaxID=52824 RepID=A0A8X7TU55_BRACI|nr:hypothetical protein Bca52824_083980 [Brassica carinata]